MVSCPVGKLTMFGMFIGGLIPWRLFREFRVLKCGGEPPASTTASLTGGVSGSGKVTNGSVRSAFSDPLPSLQGSTRISNERWTTSFYFPTEFGNSGISAILRFHFPNWVFLSRTPHARILFDDLIHFYTLALSSFHPMGFIPSVSVTRMHLRYVEADR